MSINNRINNDEKLFLLVTANNNESDALLGQMTEVKKGERSHFTHDANFYNRGKLGLYNVIHLNLISQAVVKADATIISVLNAIDAFHPDAIILVGVAFGFDDGSLNKQIIGDVLISKTVSDYESAVIRDGKEMSDAPSPESGRQLISIFDFYSKTWAHQLPQRNAKCFIGEVLSGDKFIDDLQFKTKLFNKYPLAYGGEMEGRGAYAACRSRDINEWIVVKGICDWGNGNTAIDKKQNQILAANSAVSLLKYIFSDPRAFEKLPKHKYNHSFINAAPLTNNTEYSQIYDGSDSRVPRVFISYCREDIAHEHVIKKIITDISTKYPKLEVFYKDKGKKNSLGSVNSKVTKVDLVLVLCSNNYKNVIDSHNSERSVYKEYMEILELSKIAAYKIVPIILDGTVSTAIPNSFSKLDIQDLSNTRDYQQEKERKRRNSAVFTTRGKKKYNRVIESLLTQLEINYKQYKATYPAIKSIRRIFDELFRFRKSDANCILPKNCMIVPEAYNLIFFDRKLILIGRKGSGKSTFFEILEHFDTAKYNDNFKSLEIVKYDGLPVEDVYALCKEFEKDSSVYSIHDILDLFWCIYVFLFSVCIIGFILENPEKRKHLESRKNDFMYVTEKFINSLGEKNYSDNYRDKNKVFVDMGKTTVEIIRNYLNSGVFNNATLQSYRSSIYSHISWKDALGSFFNDHEDRTHAYIQALNQCSKRILFAIDGFDNASEYFRMNTNQMLESNDESEKEVGRERRKFLKLFDSHMITKIIDLKDSAKMNFMQMIDICIIIPRDRYEVFRDNVRDISKIPLTQLNWDAIELGEMITKRLRYFIGKVIEDGDRDSNYRILLSSDVDINKLKLLPETDELTKQFEHYVQQLLPNIPLEIDLDGVGKMSLFNYVLSLSMWRPRDILNYFETLFTISRNVSGVYYSKAEMNTAVRVGLSIASESILQDEFIGEYNKVFTNIDDVLNSLCGSNMFCKGYDLKKRIDDIKFLTAFALDDGSFSSKLRILYELGVIGINVDKATKSKYNLFSDHCFVFNQGSLRHETFDENTNIVFNPMFKTRLGLESNIRDEGLIGNYSIEQLRLMHATRGIKH